MPFVSNVMVVGDHKKYLACLITLKEDPPMSGKLEQMSQDILASKGCQVKTVEEALKNEKLK